MVHDMQIDVQPDALLVTTAADVTIERLNATLHAHGLGLPIAPLVRNMSLATLIGHNAGGRRRLRYGAIARYLRAATITPAGMEFPLTVGGPTLKRATGYGLNRALAGGAFAGGIPLLAGAIHDVTLNLRPLPPARRALLCRCTDLPAAGRLGATLLARGLPLSALAVRPAADATALLVELEAAPIVIERQTTQIEALARETGVTLQEIGADERLWAEWEDLAAEWRNDGALTIDLNLPRATIPEFSERADALARRYRRELTIWGDVGVGGLHVCVEADSADGEARQVATLLYDLVRRLGGSLGTEFGDNPLVTALWRHEARERGAARLWTAPLVATNGGDHSRLLERLREVVGPTYVRTRAEDLACYDQDASIAQAPGVPLAVVLPANTAEVSATLHLAAETGVAVVTRGAGSGLAGGTTPSAGALVLALSRMERLRIDAEQMVAYAEAGVTTADLQQAAEKAGLFYPPDPSSQRVSSIGGNIACNAGGPRCLKYGVTSDYVLGMTAVLADGAVIRAGDGLTGQTPDAALLNLVIGSEGTLAVITAATLRLVAQPAMQRTTLAIFDRLADATTTVEAIMAAGIIPAGLELMDGTTIAVVEEYLQLGLPRDAGAMLLLLADGEPEAVEEDAARLADLARRGGARSVQVAQKAADEAGLWRARRAIAPALARFRPNRLGEDISVPLPQIANCVRQINAISERYDQPIAVFGHAGDGNLHPNILFDGRDPAQVERVWPIAGEIFRVALDLGGTLSGEHGIGTLKRPFMEAALGVEGVALQRRIKAAFDPRGLLNPGKVLP